MDGKPNPCDSCDERDVCTAASPSPTEPKPALTEAQIAARARFESAFDRAERCFGVAGRARCEAMLAFGTTVMARVLMGMPECDARLMIELVYSAMDYAQGADPADYFAVLSRAVAEAEARNG